MSDQAGVAAARMRTALDLHRFGVELMRQNLRRRHPGESAEGIEQLLNTWLQTRPGATDGDAEGIPRRLDSA